YFKIDIKDILIIYDDMALPIGEIRVREKGSSGSHKGMQNIIDNLHTEDIKRIRVGIGEPKSKEAAIDYVLSRPNKEEMELIWPAIDRARDLAIRFINEDFHVLVSTY
ncbi:MAG: aminoacyl-tRNA hydrolase, partial [Coprobacillus sp.]|nr:aminoacyl-tRNA hydrolase [Coprobacillus sp.]